MNPEPNHQPVTPEGSKDMHGREQGSKRKRRCRLNIDIREDLGALLEKELARKNMTQADWVHTVVTASLLPGRTRTIFEDLLNSKLKREIRAVLDEAVYLLSQMQGNRFYSLRNDH